MYPQIHKQIVKSPIRFLIDSISNKNYLAHLIFFKS